MHRAKRCLSRFPYAVAAVAFVLAALAAAAVIWYSEKAQLASERAMVVDLTVEQAHAIELHIEQSLSAAYGLATLIQMSRGDIAEFENMAGPLLSFYPGVAALQVAPGGVIARVMPHAGNEKSVGHNLLTDPARDKEAFLARDTGRLTLSGPFSMVQGGQGAAGRMPIYLRDDADQSRFWGFAVVLLRFPDTLKATRLPQLAERGYNYALWRVHPDTGTRHVIAKSGAAPVDPVERVVQVPNAQWMLSVSPSRGWGNTSILALKALLGLMFSALAAYAAYILPSLARR